MQNLPEHIVLTSPRWKMWLAMLVFLILAGLGVAMLIIGEESDRFLGWIAIVLFGSGAVIGALLAIFPSKLELRPDGFSRIILGRELSFRWNQISDLQVVRYKSTTLIHFTVRDPLAPESKGKRKSLGDTFGMKGPELVDLMERFRDRAISQKTS